MFLCQQLRSTGASLTQRKRLPSATPLCNTEDKFFKKSYTQVAASVLPKSVIQKSCGLKPKKKILAPVPVRYSEEQLEQLEAKAKRAGVSRSEYIRALSLGEDYKPPLGRDIRHELLKTNRQLTGIATNVNQMAHRMNSGAAEAPEALVFLERILEPVLQTIGLIRQTLARNTEPMP